MHPARTLLTATALLVAGPLAMGLTDQCTLSCPTSSGSQPVLCPNSCTQWSETQNMLVDACSSLSLNPGQTYEQPISYSSQGFNIIKQLHIHALEAGTTFTYCVTSPGAPFYGQCASQFLTDNTKAATLSAQAAVKCVDIDNSGDITNMETNAYAYYPQNLTTIYLDSYCPVANLNVQIMCQNYFTACNLAVNVHAIQNCTYCRDVSTIGKCTDFVDSDAPSPLPAGYVLYPTPAPTAKAPVAFRTPTSGSSSSGSSGSSGSGTNSSSAYSSTSGAGSSHTISAALTAGAVLLVAALMSA